MGTSKTNVLRMPPRELGDRPLDSEFLLTSRMLGELLYSCANEALGRLAAAETDALRRIAEYTPQDRLLTIEEAAAYLGFKPRTLRSWCEGEHPTLQFSLIGGKLRFRKVWLDNAVESRSVRPRKVAL